MLLSAVISSSNGHSDAYPVTFDPEFRYKQIFLRFYHYLGTFRLFFLFFLGYKCQVFTTNILTVTVERDFAL